jgi:hypothetical protein
MDPQIDMVQHHRHNAKAAQQVNGRETLFRLCTAPTVSDNEFSL